MHNGRGIYKNYIHAVIYPIVFKSPPVTELVGNMRRRVLLPRLLNATNTWRIPVLDPAELPTLGHLFRLHCWVHVAHVSPKHVKLHTRHIYRAPNLTGRQEAYCDNHMFRSFPFHSRLKTIHDDGMLRWNAAHADLHQS